MITADSADDDVQPATFTVHGFLRGTEGRVTLVDAENTGRNMTLNVLADRGSERLIARYAVLGDHLDGPHARFKRVQFRLKHLDAWAQLREGLSVRFAEHGSHAQMNYAGAEPQTAATITTPGSLTLDATFRLPPPSVVEVRFIQRAFLMWESSADGLSVDQLWARVLDPVRSLLTIASGDDCPVTTMHVQVEGGRWLRVLHPGIDNSPDELRSGRDMVLTAPALSLSDVATWLDQVDRLSPVPQLVAGHVARERDQVVESQVLELAAAAEGLHRRLEPDERVMTDEQARQIRSACLAAVPPDSRQMVANRLGQLADPTFRQRLALLADRLGNAAADITGVTSLWTRYVAEARNGFAHMLDPRRETDVEHSIVLRDSLRWMLTIVLLAQAGVSMETIMRRVSGRQDYQFFLRRASAWLPGVYAGRSDEDA